MVVSTHPVSASPSPWFDPLHKWKEATRLSPLIPALPPEVPSTRENLAEILVPPVEAKRRVPKVKRQGVARGLRRVATGAELVLRGVFIGATVCLCLPVALAIDGVRKAVQASDRYTGLPEAIQPFLRRAPQWRDQVDIEALALTPEQTQTFAFFLRKIDRAHVKLDCANLSHCLMELTAAMQGDAALTAVLIDTMHDMLTSCADRRARGLNELYVALLTHRAECAADAGTALRQLAKQLVQLEVVHACAATKFSHESVERYLAFELLVGTYIPLPLWSLQGEHIALAEISACELEAALLATSRVTDAHVDNYLRAWAPWQRHVRAQLAKAIRYDALSSTPPTASAVDPEATCSITLMQAAQMREAVVHQTTPKPQVYDYQALMHWWVLYGTDPTTRQRLALDPALYQGPLRRRLDREISALSLTDSSDVFSGSAPPVSRP